MNGTLPVRNCGHRSGDSGWQSGLARPVPSAFGLVHGIANPPEREPPPGGNPAARVWPNAAGSSVHGIGALAVFALDGNHVQAHLLADGPDKKPRTECACQPVACINSPKVAPSLRINSSRIADALLPSRALLGPLAGFFAWLPFTFAEPTFRTTSGVCGAAGVATLAIGAASGVRLA